MYVIRWQLGSPFVCMFHTTDQYLYDPILDLRWCGLLVGKVMRA
jgi:hypothetical protein